MLSVECGERRAKRTNLWFNELRMMEKWEHRQFSDIQISLIIKWVAEYSRQWTVDNGKFNWKRNKQQVLQVTNSSFAVQFSNLFWTQMWMGSELIQSFVDAECGLWIVDCVKWYHFAIKLFRILIAFYILHTLDHY